MTTILIKGGRVIDPASGRDETGDVWIVGGRIAKSGRKAARTIDARGKWVVPGLIDIHVHFREPGHEAKETIADGCAAAVAGGFTSVATMANTGRPVDSAMAVRYVRDRAGEAGLARVFPIGAVTQNLAGEELAEMGLMAQAGAVAFSDDGHPVMNSEILRRALEYAAMFKKPVISHCEDAHLTKGAAMNEGRVATELGLRGWPAVAEASMAARDAMLARWTGARVHIAHVSAKETVEVIRAAKKAGDPVTAEAAPHHLALDEESLRTYDPRFRMNPPLRSAQDVQALIEALADGTIDCIASDHAPHTVEDKDKEFDACPNGVVGLETTVGVVLTDLVAAGKLTATRAVEAMTSGPARVLGLPHGTLAPGAEADVTILDPARKWKVDSKTFRSRGRCTPWEGRTLTGAAVVTIVGGRVVSES
ncbi:MAG TPA: dihydroorotase [Planctomycetota bacterium]|nr:dihydroorotase [Planctomycetota bacterium]